MKELVIIVGMMVLGCIIFGFIAGDTGSLKSATKDVMLNSISVYAE